MASTPQPVQLSVPDDSEASVPELEVPPMRVVVLLSGTQGDVMPFIQMAHMMAERHGHIVRIASHDDLRGVVEKAGLRFFPMKGNARQMAGWGPSFSLHIPTLLNLMINPATTTKMIVIRQIILATIRACTEPDPADPNAEPFHADCIMANPMSFGHIHCAEALGVPLHLFFPNPWVATEDVRRPPRLLPPRPPLRLVLTRCAAKCCAQYPHSFSGWDYPCTATPGTSNGFAWVRKPAHRWSYRVIDFFLWHAFLPAFNELRASCGLRTLRLGFAATTVVRDQCVPFSQMWSPSLCPRPADWPSQARVVGFFFWDQKAAEVDESSPELAPLMAWLAQGEKPIYIGFGSMVFNGVKTTRMVVEAARLSGKRVLMQTATEGGKLQLSDPSDMPPNVFSIGRCSHDWLLPKCAAVIHHGGAGTTGGGLRLGLPSMCCPFFGDQFFYGHCIAASGCGPPPIPFTRLTVAALADAFGRISTDPRYAEGAQQMAARIKAENGLENGLADFNRHLPLAEMVCDVSTLMHEKSLGRVYYPALRLKVSDEVHATLCSSSAIDTRLLASARPHVTKTWDLGAHVRDPCTGVFVGAIAFVWELADAMFSLLVLPLKSAAHNGLSGLVLGILAAIALLLARLVYAPIILFDRVATGIANWRACGCSQHPETRQRPLDHVLDPESLLTRVAQAPRGHGALCGPALSARIDGGHADGSSRLPLHGPSRAADGERRAAIEAAFTRVVALRRAFDALDASSNDDALSPSELSTLDAPASHDVSAYAPSAAAASAAESLSSMPFSTDRLPALSEMIGRYMRRRGKRHISFAEFVLLCRAAPP